MHGWPSPDGYATSAATWLAPEALTRRADQTRAAELLEARRRLGYDWSRWGGLIPYPAESVAGPLVALTYVAAIDALQIKVGGAHFGRTPKKYQSGETDVSGRISKMGDGSVRTALYEAAAALRVLLHLMAGSKEDAETVTAFFEDMKRRGLNDPLLVTSDGAPGIIKAIEVEAGLALPKDASIKPSKT